VLRTMQRTAPGYKQTRVFMDTPVIIELSPPEHDDAELAERIERAFGWFAEVERSCSRFDEASELRTLSRHIGKPVRASALLFSVLDVALAVADITGGALDPAVGRAMEQSGFNTNYRTGETVTTPGFAGESSVTYRDVHLDRDARTVTLRRPLALDLGAVAKGFAIDLAARELSGLCGFVINAGGDIFARGLNPHGEPWRIGVRHPRRHDELLTVLRVTDAAVCTSGDYERLQTNGEGHHILDPLNGKSAGSVASVTVVAPAAAVADALSTAVFVLGPRAGLDLLNKQGVDGLIVDPELNVVSTAGLEMYKS